MVWTKQGTLTPPGIGKGGQPYVEFRGPWSAARAYYAGDLILWQNQLYEAKDDIAATAPASSFIGSSAASNTAAKTTTTAVALPAGSAAGDYAVIGLALHNQPAAAGTTIADMSGIAGAAFVLRAADTTGYTSNTDVGVQGVYTKILTAADITAGSLSVPIQSAANNASTTALDATLMVFRGVNSVLQSGAGFATQTNSTAVLAQGPSAMSDQGVGFVAWFLSTHCTNGAGTTPTFTPTAAASNRFQTSTKGAALMGYAAADGAVSQETVGYTLSALPAAGYGAQVLEVEVGYVGTFDPTKWTPLADGTPPGIVQMYAATSTPGGWLKCDGSNVSRTTYAALFAAIGTTYGIGDGVSTFTLPNMNSAFVRGNTPGLGGGSDTHTHTPGTFAAPSHTHALGAHTHDLADTVGFAEIDITTGGNVVVRRQAPAFTYTQTSGGNAGAVTGTGTANSSAGLTGRTSSMTSGAAATGGPSATAVSGTTDPATAVPVYTGVQFIIKT